MAIDYGGVIKRLKDKKAEKGLTNEALSEKSGVPLGTVNKLFAGSIGSIKLGTLALLAEALEIPLVSALEAGESSVPGGKKGKAGDNFGYLRAGVASPAIRVADVDHNAAGIISAAERAAGKGVKILVLPELSLTGYTLGDLFYQTALLEAAERGVKRVAEETADLELLLFFGAPIRREGRIYNCAVAVCNGEILGVIPKTYLPNYNEFYDKRQFNPAPRENSDILICGRRYPFGTGYVFRNTEMPEMRVGAEICEDLWAAETPSTRLAVNGATVIVNLSCSDETIGKAEYRRNLISMQAAKTFTAYLYANAGEGESTTDMVFSGHSIICDNGKILAETKLFTSSDAYADLDLSRIEFDRSKFTNYVYPSEGGVEFIDFSLTVDPVETTREYEPTPFVPSSGKELSARAELILNMQANALKKRLEHTGVKNVVLGISGGLDSTLALLVCVRAFDLLGLDREGIRAVTMPCFGTTSRTHDNAVLLADYLGCSLEEIDIQESVSLHFRDIGHDPSVTDITYENSQARERTQVLMDLSNKYNGIVIGTGDLSELALGWATYNGDHMSMYAVNSSVPKTLIRFLIIYESKKLGKDARKVLEDILATPVSPELLPHDNGRITQKTEDVVGPYVLHDFFLYHMLRNGFKPSKIYRIAVKTFKEYYTEATVYKWLNVFTKRFFSQQFKRSCMPDGVKIGSVTLSPRGDWRMPSDATAALWLKDLEKIKRIQ